MAKITLDAITSSFASTSLFDTNFTAIEDELNDKVLYRDNPMGEANQMENDLDMNSNDVLNVDNLDATTITLGGTPISPSVVTVAATGVTYDNTTSGLTATDAQAAIDEVEANITSNDVQLARGNNHGKNLLTNGDFSINQREVTGSVVLSAGEYGHDRVRGGASGCTYTFATSAGVTTITISAGTLEQEIEGASLPAINVVLSWGGTAQGRIDGGTYGSTGVTDTTTGGANTIVEFNTGTLSKVQLEEGSVATDFEHVTPADQLSRCQRYFERLTTTASDESILAFGAASTTTSVVGHLAYKTKRVIPTVTAGSGLDITTPGGSPSAVTLSTVLDTGLKGGRLSVTRVSGTHTTNDPFFIRTSNAANNYLDVDAEL